MKKGWKIVTLGEVFALDLDAVPVSPSGAYAMAGVLSFGRGLFEKAPVHGVDTSYKTFFRLQAGQIVLSQLFGWEGAIAPVTPDFAGRFVSSQFPTFRPKPNLAPAFARWLIRNPQLWDQLRSGAKGMGDRRRTLSPEIFLGASSALPPLAEQQRIAAHLDAIEARLARVQELREESRTEGQALTISLHHHLSDKRFRRLDELLRLDEEYEPITADGSYPQVGIRSFGEGMFRKPPTRGSETTYRAFNTLRAGKLAMSQVKGWEGAVAVCPDDLDGWFVSPEYRTFACREGQCDPAYLSHLVETRWFHEHLASATRGVGARRERIRPEMLLGIEIPFPDLTGQRTALKTIEHMTEAKALFSQSAPLEEALLPSLLDRVFN